MILAGHGRATAAQRLGYDLVPIVRLGHLSPEQQQAYITLDNKMSDLGEWDYDLLTEQMEQITANFNLADLGFSDVELNNLLASVLPPPMPAAPQRQGAPSAAAAYDDYPGSDATVDDAPPVANRDKTTGEKMDPHAKLERYIASSIRYMQLNYPEQEFEKLTKLMQGLCRSLKLDSNAALVEYLVKQEAAKIGGLVDEDTDSQASAN
jgi:hypothetical protein